MKAALWYGRKDIRVEEVAAPKAEKGEVIIEVKRCGICGTDLHEYTDGPQVTWNKPHPITGDTVPIIMGHEFAGVISEIGEGVSGWNIGDRVAIMPLLHCGKCVYCLRGLQHLCVDFGCTGLQWYWGGFAEYCKALPYQLNKIPDNVTFEQAACIEPMALAMYGIHRSGLKAGDTVFISGGGPTAVLTLMAARAAGATKIFMSEVSPKRLARLLAFGADEAYNPMEVDVVAEVLKKTNGLGTDVVIECAGIEEAINDCFEIVKKRGMYVQSGLSVKPISIKNHFDWAFKDINMCGLWCYNITDFQNILELMGTGQLPSIERIVTKTIKVEDIVKEGFDVLTVDSDGAEVKIQVSFE